MKNQQHQVGKTARAMMDGSLNYFRGAKILVDLREALGVYANDPDFIVFVAVINEVDYLRDANDQFDWSLCDKPELQAKLNKSTCWAKEISLHHLEALTQRYT